MGQALPGVQPIATLLVFPPATVLMLFGAAALPDSKIHNFLASRETVGRRVAQLQPVRCRGNLLGISRKGWLF